MIHIINKNLHIREITNSDLPTLHVWRNSDDFIKFCTKRKSKISFIDFGYEINKDLKQDRLIQVIISSDNTLIGTLYAYRFNEKDKTIYLTAYFLPPYHAHISVIKSLVLFIKYLFEIFHISKLYVEVYSYNKKVVKMLENMGFEYEDRISRYDQKNRKKYDLLILSFSKKKICTTKIKNLVQRLT